MTVEEAIAVMHLRDALQPLARLAECYRRSELDEHRPEWTPCPTDEVVLVIGRGGANLLTLADVFRAEAAFKASLELKVL